MRSQIALAPVRYNEIPKTSKILTEIKKLGRDEKVKYRVCGAFDPKQPDKFFGRTLILPTTDTVTDPDTSEVYDIAYVKGVGVGGAQEIGEIVFDDFHASTITLFGRDADDQRKYMYLEMCNFLADNKNRNGKDPLIERVNEKVDLQDKRDKRKKVTAALNAVEAMTDQEILDFVRANRMPDAGSSETRRAKVEDFAESMPEKFSMMPMIDYTSLYELIDNAKKAKIIVFNNVTREWQRFEGTPIVQVKKGFGVSNKDDLAQFLMKTEGHIHRDWMIAELKKKP